LLALQLVDDLKKGSGAFFTDIFAAQEFSPHIAVAEAHAEITRAESQPKHHVHGERDQVSVGGGAFFAEDVGIELIKLATPALLWFFITKARADLKPLHRLAIIALPGRGHAGERRRRF